MSAGVRGGSWEVGLVLTSKGSNLLEVGRFAGNSATVEEERTSPPSWCQALGTLWGGRWSAALWEECLWQGPGKHGLLEVSKKGKMLQSVMKEKAWQLWVLERHPGLVAERRKGRQGEGGTGGCPSLGGFLLCGEEKCRRVELLLGRNKTKKKTL